MADTLNYFLIYLTGSKRKELKVCAHGAGGRVLLLLLLLSGAWACSPLKPSLWP